MSDEADAPPRPALAGELEVDICIVGGGFTGLWAGLELKQRDPSLRVALVEAAVCGAGASGANAGYAMNMWPKLPALVAAGGVDRGVAMARSSVAAVQHLIDFCAQNQINAQIERAGWLWASTNSAQDGAWEPVLDLADQQEGFPFVTLDAGRASELAGADVRGGVFDPTCANVHPARLARGLARVAEVRGVMIFESSPMTSLMSDARGTVVTTPGGSVRSSSVILAINAWATQFDSVRPYLVMTASDNIVVQPKAGGPGRAMRTGVSDSGRLLDYWRPLDDRRVLFGKGGVGIGYSKRGASSLFRDVPRKDGFVKHMIHALPHLHDATLVSAWRAPVEYSLSSLPFFDVLPGHPRVFYGTGYSGDGVGPSVIGGRILASLATDTHDEWSGSFLARAPRGAGLPPEPFRFLGGQLVKGALLRRERLEDEERRVDPVTRLVSQIDPTSFVG